MGLKKEILTKWTPTY